MFMKESEKYSKLAYSENSIFAIHVDGELPGGHVQTMKLMPNIKNVRELDKNDRRVVIVYFTDGTKTKAVLCPGDTYSFEQGISICITKKLLEVMSGGNGSGLYNKLIKHAYKVIEKNKFEAEKAEQERLAEIERQKKEVEKKERELRRFAHYIARIIDEDMYGDEDDDEISYADLMATMHDMGFNV